jgi:hypothetical protein
VPLISGLALEASTASLGEFRSGLFLVWFIMFKVSGSLRCEE